MRSSVSSPTLAEPQATPPIFRKYATSTTRRSTASRRTRKSDASAERERLRKLRAIKVYYEDLEARWAQEDDEYARTSGVLEDVARALELQKRMHARKAAQQKLQPVTVPDSSDSEPFTTPISVSSASSESSSRSPTRVASQPFPGHVAAEEDEGSGCVTPPRASRSKSSQWFSRFNPRISQRELDIQNDAPSSLSKRLAPLSRFNPFVRARSESLSSIDEYPIPSPSRRRTLTLAGKT